MTDCLELRDRPDWFELKEEYPEARLCFSKVAGSLLGAVASSALSSQDMLSEGLLLLLLESCCGE